jgi:predicted nuclease with TOPRIM domain
MEMLKTLKKQIQISHKLTEVVEQKDKLIAELQGSNRRFSERKDAAEQRLADTESRLGESRAKVIGLMQQMEKMQDVNGTQKRDSLCEPCFDKAADELVGITAKASPKYEPLTIILTGTKDALCGIKIELSGSPDNIPIIEYRYI